MKPESEASARGGAEEKIGDRSTFSEIYDRMSDADKKKAFFFLLGIVEFYGDSDTWFAVSLLPDPPCGDIVKDIRKDYEGTYRPGGRARLAYSWILSAFKRTVREDTCQKEKP